MGGRLYIKGMEEMGNDIHVLKLHRWGVGLGFVFHCKWS
jgi:hypothetical protein